MKMGLAHVVPLSDASLAILESMAPLRGQGDYIFPGIKIGAALSTNALLVVLKKSLKRLCTVHGFRSTFRDWAGDCTEFPREVAEAALAHSVGDRTEAAYRRSSALAKRRELMNAWAGFCAGLTSHTQAA
jgi:integrase